MIDCKKRLEAQFDFVKSKIQDVKQLNESGNLVIRYYYFDKEYKLEIAGVINSDSTSIDCVAYNHIINGYL